MGREAKLEETRGHGRTGAKDRRGCKTRGEERRRCEETEGDKAVDWTRGDETRGIKSRGNEETIYIR